MFSANSNQSGGVDATTDPYFNYTTLLLSGDGTNGAQNNTFIDSSVNTAAITRAGTPTQGSLSPFSQTGWSGYFNGSSHLEPNASLNTTIGGLAGSLWTMESWVYVSSISSGNGYRTGIFGTYQAVAAQRWWFGYNSTNGTDITAMFTTANSAGTEVQTGGTITFALNSWVHLAVTIDASTASSSTITLYVNGVGQSFTGKNLSPFTTNYTAPPIGGNYSAYVNNHTGYMSSLRLVKGVAVYTGNFTPPTTPLTPTQAGNGSTIQPITGTATSLLTLQDNRFKDNSTNNFTITAVGTPSVQAFSPFAPTAAYSLPAAAAGSAYFNGSTNLTVPASSQLTLGADDYTIECWFNITGAQSTTYGWGIAGTYDGASNGGWSLGVNRDTGAYGIDFIDNNTRVLTYGTYFLTNTWYHLALVKSGSSANNLKAYVNGIQVSAVTYNTADTTVATCYIGSQYTGQKFPGYISNLRVVKGTAVYTGNFTPPGAPLTKIQSAGTNIAAITGTAPPTVDYLVVGGGAGGSAGGGGAGGYRTGTALPVIVGNTYTVTVGSGGAGAYSRPGTAANGLASVFSAISAAGGGGGGSNNAGGVASPGASGGSGGGGGIGGNGDYSGGIGNTPSVSPVQGYNGASGGSGGGGGGGSSAAGESPSTTAGIGGAGTSNSITGSAVYYAGGGGGGSIGGTGGVGGIGGGGTGGDSAANGVSGAANTGGGGGGGGINAGGNTFGLGGNGGSGIVVLRHADTYPTATTTGTVSVTTSGGYKIYSFTTSGSITFSDPTTLLTLQDSTFKDNSSYTNALTASSPAPVIQSFTPFTQVWGGSFSGSSYLQAPVSANLALGTGNFTVEAWVYLNSVTGVQGVYSSIDTGADAWQGVVLGFNGTSFQATSYISGTDTITHQNTVGIGAWYHVALVRNGSITKSYLNGTQSTSTTSGNYNLTQSGSTIGSFYVGSSPLNGYISNLRVVKGTAVYTGAFTPPAKTLSATQAAGVNISAITGTATSLLTLQDPTFKDNAILPNTITASATPPKAQLVSAPFTSAATVDPVNGSAYFAASEKLSRASIGTSIGTGDFSIECWAYVPSGAALNSTMVQLNTSSTYDLYLQISANTLRILDYNNPAGTHFALSGGTINNNTWYHILLTRQSGTVRGFINGNLILHQTGVTFNFGTAAACIINAGLIVSAISNVRVVLGNVPTAYQTSSITAGTQIFTPSTTPLTAVTGTSLLTLQDTTFIDKSGNTLPITATGTPSMRAFTPFASNWGGYFNGSSNLLVPSGAPFNLTTVDFCIEMWVYPIAQSSYGALLSFDVQDYPLMFQWASAGSANIRFYAGSSTAWISGTPLDFGTTVLNTWAHICVTRTNGVFRTFKDGILSTVLAGQEAYSIGNSAGSVYVGSNGAAGGFSTAYISNLRIIKGTGNVPAAYQTSSTTLGTTIFTPPTSPLAAVTGTSLLTLQNNTFIDNATPPNTINTSATPPKTQLLDLPFTSSITKVAAPWNISVTAPLATVGGSMYFNGSNYVSVPKTTALEPATSGAWTIEFLCYTTSTSSQSPWTYGNATISSGPDLGTYFNVIGNSAVQAGFYSSTQPTTISGGILTLNQWHHLALVSNGTMMTLYLNGVSVGTPVNISGSVINAPSSATGRIGQYNSGSPQYFNGYISNFRFAKGTAVYTGNFTPPSAPPQPTQPAGLLGTNVNAVDGTNTSLLLLGSNAGIYDATAKNDLVTVGNAQVSSTQIKYGTGAMYFDGTGDYLTAPSNSALAFPADFTIECWVYPLAWASNAPICSGSTGAVQLSKYGSNDNLGVAIQGLAWEITNAVLPTLNTWSHVALTRSGSTLKIFINGVQSGSTGSTAYSFTTTNLIGGDGTSYFQGYIDDLRITKGIARYTTTFTPPTKAMIGQ